MKMVMRCAACAGVLLVGVALAGPSWAVNKCVGADGRVSFQDAPCAGAGGAIVVRPASGAAPRVQPAPAPAQGGTGNDAARPAPRKEGAFGERWQRRTYLENRGVPDAIAELEGLKRECRRKLDELEARKDGANNNLAGATYMQSLSAQMQAEATMCDVRTREALARRQAMEAELRALQDAR